MIDPEPRFRWAASRLPSSAERRLVLLAGARQTGKTTLARSRWPGLRYVNFDAAETRDSLLSLPAASWSGSVGPAILDEAQKAPGVLEKLKFAFDAGDVGFTAVLGSTALLLLEQVRESLAGRVFVHGLWPLLPTELLHAADATPERPLLDALLRAEGRIDRTLREVPAVLLGADDSVRRAAIDHLVAWGGMPGLLPLSDDDRKDWLRSYRQTVIERDLPDLVRVPDAAGFLTFQRLAMLRTGELLSWSSFARDAQTSPQTAKRRIELLAAAFQVLLLPPHHENLTSELVKAPKLHWVDVGLLRHALQQWGPLTGPQFESFVVSQVHQWIDTMGVDARLSHYRSRSGLEVDLLVRTPHGVLGIETKNRDKPARADARALVRVAASLGDRWLGGVVVTTGSQIVPLAAEQSVWAVPLHRLLA